MIFNDGGNGNGNHGARALGHLANALGYLVFGQQDPDQAQAQPPRQGGRGAGGGPRVKKECCIARRAAQMSALRRGGR
jgi:hypothetical protein